MLNNNTTTILPNITEKYVSNIFGWFSFIVWSISFYPQLYTNCIRKKTEGMSIDMNMYGLEGYVFYSIICIFFIFF